MLEIFALIIASLCALLLSVPAIMTRISLGVKIHYQLKRDPPPLVRDAWLFLFGLSALYPLLSLISALLTLISLIFGARMLALLFASLPYSLILFGFLLGRILGRWD